jgi:hypothetical protein
MGVKLLLRSDKVRDDKNKNAKHLQQKDNDIKYQDMHATHDKAYDGRGGEPAPEGLANAKSTTQKRRSVEAKNS